MDSWGQALLFTKKKKTTKSVEGGSISEDYEINFHKLYFRIGRSGLFCPHSTIWQPFRFRPCSAGLMLHPGLPSKGPT